MSDSYLKEYYDYLDSSKKESESITTPVPIDSLKLLKHPKKIKFIIVWV